MRSLVVVAVASMVGCADPGAPFQQRMSTSRIEGSLQVSGPFYGMRFARDDDTHLQLPTSLSVSDTDEMLGQGAGCPRESLVGVAAYPLATASADASGESELTVVEDGVGFTQVRVLYSVPYSCSGNQALSGTTTYSFYPSGRIVRHDVARPSGSAITNADGCGCAQLGNEPKYFTSYWTFNAAVLVDLAGAALPEGPTDTQVCALSGTTLAALEWPDGAIRHVNPGNATTTYDWVGGQMTLESTEREVVSRLQLAPNQTTASCATVHGFLVERPLIVDGMRMATTPDGYYYDGRPHTSSFQLVAEDGDVPPFAIRLNLGGLRHARLSRSDGSFSVQEASDGEFIFWFDDGLANFQSIAIEPY